MSSTTVWVPTYFTKCFHFTGSMPHYFNVAYTKAQCCGRILITAFVRPFLAAYLITGWNQLTVNILTCQTHLQLIRQKSLVQPLSFKDKSCIVSTELYRRSVTISISCMRTNVETHLFGNAFGFATLQLLVLKCMWILDGNDPTLNCVTPQLS